ncbi:DNA polymerase III [Cryobacterium zongtaii]|uniref:DNA polymerase III n=1 Tax=Cryobacterium zongtaii TaxID=1259217 RepID=A0A2S3ZBH3_9MICO|nr:exonuclease domain-containing protein [Cryobacterium zongtaii]POH62964.1 DNA polymerase III [Cryobacterium zongtaii]
MPLNFVSIDFETANFDRASVCAVGLTKVVDGRVSSTESWFVTPPTGLDFTNTYLHGIGLEQVSGAPSWQESLQRISQVADGDPLIAYSPFDKGVYNAANNLTGTPSSDFAFFDALAIVRHHCQLPSHKLPLVIAHFGLAGFDHHEAGADSLACAQITLRVAQERGAGTVEELWASVPARDKVRATRSRIYQKKADLPQASAVADPHHPLFGEVICFSGDLDSYTRSEAQNLVASFGAAVSGNVTKKTSLVVMGGFDPATLRVGATLSSKIQRAQELAVAGQSIEIVTEQTFLEILTF